MWDAKHSKPCYHKAVTVKSLAIATTTRILHYLLTAFNYVYVLLKRKKIMHVETLRSFHGSFWFTNADERQINNGNNFQIGILQVISYSF